MSWVMRVAADKDIKTKNPVLYKRCFDILMKLIKKDSEGNVEVSSVRVWKQWRRIDVIAHVVVKCNGIEEKHVVILEDKAYTMIHDEQLKRYAAIVNEVYATDDDLKVYAKNKHFWVITFFGYNKQGKYEDGYKALKEMCNSSKPKWGLISFDDVLEDKSPTGSEHFDDFWINEW